MVRKLTLGLWIYYNYSNGRRPYPVLLTVLKALLLYQPPMFDV